MILRVAGTDQPHVLHVPDVKLLENAGRTVAYNNIQERGNYNGGCLIEAVVASNEKQRSEERRGDDVKKNCAGTR